MNHISRKGVLMLQTSSNTKLKNQLKFFCIKTIHHHNAKLNMKLGFIGIGKIAQAIMIGLVDRNIINDHQIYASDKNLKHVKSNETFQKYKINICETNEEVIRNVNTVIISVKPNDVPCVLKGISPSLTENHLLLSIAAGVKLNQIRSVIPSRTRVVRIMTNIAALIQEGCSVYAKANNCTAGNYNIFIESLLLEISQPIKKAIPKMISYFYDIVFFGDVKLVEVFLNSIGTCEGEIEEELIDVVTALSGSGPAYMCIVAESLADGAVKMGLDRDFALQLATRTMLGTAMMLLKCDSKNLNQIKENVSSPGGTTIHGIGELEKNSFRHALISCVEKATIRSKELNSNDKY